MSSHFYLGIHATVALPAQDAKDIDLVELDRRVLAAMQELGFPAEYSISVSSPQYIAGCGGQAAEECLVPEVCPESFSSEIPDS